MHTPQQNICSYVCKAILLIVLCAIAGIIGVEVFEATHSSVVALIVASVFVVVFLYTAHKDNRAR